MGVNTFICVYNIGPPAFPSIDSDLWAMIGPGAILLTSKDVVRPLRRAQVPKANGTKRLGVVAAQSTGYMDSVSLVL